MSNERSDHCIHDAGKRKEVKTCKMGTLPELRGELPGGRTGVILGKCESVEQ